MSIHQSQSSIFHLAIPTHDLVAAKEFYKSVLGCRVAREYSDRITLDFFGDQLVCHLAPSEIDRQPKMYPRHFGRTFLELSGFEYVVETAQKYQVKFLEEPSIRFSDLAEKHLTVALLDPSNNVLEFKYYFVADYIY